jgi:very-short-patch-repair endonuclease
MGWKVLRLWQHEVEQDLQKCVTRVIRSLQVEWNN